MSAEENPTALDTYWAALPADDFCREFYKRAGAPIGGPFGVLQQVQLAARQAFFGALPFDWTSGPSSAFVGRDGEQGNIVTLKVNNLRSHALAQHQIVTAPEFSWKAQAVNSDSKSMASAQRGSKILEYIWKNGNDGEKLLAAVLGAIIDGEEFLFAPWSKMSGDQVSYNPTTKQVAYKGDCITHNVASWDVRRDSSAKSYDDSPWYSVRMYPNKWDLIAEFPQLRAEILANATKAQNENINTPGGSVSILPQGRDSERVAADYFFHKVTPAMPVGREALLLGDDLWLFDQPLSECYREVLPLHRMAAGDLKGTPFPYSSLWEAMAVQALADDVQGTLATNIVAFGKNLLWTMADTNLPMDQVANGPQVLYGKKGDVPPVVLQLCSSPPEAFEHLNRLRQDIRQTFGLNDISMGQPNTAQMNAQAFALIASMAITQNSDLQKKFVKVGTNLGRSKLRIFREKATLPRKVAIVGKQGPLNSMQETFTGEDFSSLDDVYVEIADPLSQTAAGRLQLSQLYIDRGFIQVPEQLQNVVETGRMEPLTEGLQAELIYIAEENEALLEAKMGGVDPMTGQETVDPATCPAVKITDSHQMHIREHRAATFSAQARGNPAVNLATDKHIREHLDFLLNTDPRILAAMGQAAPMMPMPMGPPGAPPPPGAEAGPPEGLGNPIEQADPGVPLIQPPKNPLNGQPVAAQPAVIGA